MERNMSFANFGRSATMANVTSNSNIFHGSGANLASGNGGGGSTGLSNQCEFIVPIGVASYSANGAGGGGSNTTASPTAGSSAATFPSVTSVVVDGDKATHVLTHNATCVANAKMNSSGTVVVVAGDQQISCYFDAAHAAATNAHKQSDCFSTSARSDYANPLAMSTNGTVGFAVAGTSQFDSPFSTKPLHGASSSASAYIETVTLSGSGASIVSLALETVPSEIDTLFGVVGLTNGKAVPFIIIGVAHSCYAGIAAGNTGVASWTSAGGASSVATAGLLKPRVALLPFLDLTTATSHSVSESDAVISVAIGKDTSGTSKATSSSSGSSNKSSSLVLPRIEFIAAATSNCVALFNCMPLFSHAGGSDFGGVEGIVATLFGLNPRRGNDDTTAETDDASTTKVATTQPVAQERLALLLSVLPSFFTYKGFNVYSKANVLKISALSNILSGEQCLKRVFFNNEDGHDDETDAADNANNGALAVTSPVTITHGSSASAVTAKRSRTDPNSLEIVASAVLAVVLDDGTLRFIGRCVDARAWGFGVAAGPSSSAFMNGGGNSRSLHRGDGSTGVGPLAASPSRRISRSHVGHQQQQQRFNSNGIVTSPQYNSSDNINTSATIARASAIYRMPLSAKDPEYQYISLNEATRMNPTATNTNNSSGGVGGKASASATRMNSAAFLTTSATASAANVMSPAGRANSQTQQQQQQAPSRILPSASATATATAAGLTDTYLNDADLFFNASSGFVDAIVAGVDLLRSGAIAAASIGDRSGTCNSGFFSPTATNLGDAITVQSLHFSNSVNTAAQFGGGGSNTFAAAHPNPISHSFGFVNVARSVVHGSVFHPSAAAVESYAYRHSSTDNNGAKSNAGGGEGGIVDVDVALPTPQEKVQCRVLHYQRVGHQRFDRRAFSVIRMIQLPITASQQQQQQDAVNTTVVGNYQPLLINSPTTTTTAGACDFPPSRQPCLIASGAELFFTFASSPSSATAQHHHQHQHSTAAVMASKTSSSASATTAAVLAGGGGLLSQNAPLQLLCGFGGPIQDVQILSVVPMKISSVATAVNNSTANNTTRLAITAAPNANAGVSNNVMNNNNNVGNLAAGGASRHEAYAVAALVAIGRRIHLINFTF